MLCMVEMPDCQQSAISQPLTPYQEDLSDYHSSLVAGLSEAWSTARKNISKSQGKQKLQYDKKRRPPKFRVGDRVVVFMPQETKGKACIMGLIVSWRSHQLAPLYDLWTVLISTLFL